MCHSCRIVKTCETCFSAPGNFNEPGDRKVRQLQGRLRAPPATGSCLTASLSAASVTLIERECQRIARMHLAKVVCQVQKIA